VNTKIPEPVMKISRSCVLSASILAACAGTALAQSRGKVVDASPTGEPLVREWKLGAGETMRIGLDGRPGGGPADLTHVMATLGIRYIRLDQIDHAMATIVCALPFVLPMMYFMMKRLSGDDQKTS
jgi:hypothetical protein